MRCLRRGISSGALCGPTYVSQFVEGTIKRPMQIRLLRCRLTRNQPREFAPLRELFAPDFIRPVGRYACRHYEFTISVVIGCTVRNMCFKTGFGLRECREKQHVDVEDNEALENTESLLNMWVCLGM